MSISRVLSLALVLSLPGSAFADGIQNGSSGGGGSGTVTSIATTCGISGGTITTTGTLSSNSNPNVQTGTNYAFQASDCGSIVYLSNASNQIPTIAAAGTTGFLKGYYVEVCNIGAGTQTITPTTSTIGGAATKVLPAGSVANPACVGVNSDGTNYVLDLTGPGGGPTLAGTNAWTGNNTFGQVQGSGRAVSGTTDTIAQTDCGTTINYTNAGAQTVTIPATITGVCSIAIIQLGVGKVSVNGSAVTPASLHTAVASGAAVGTRAQFSVIGIVLYQTGVAILTGDGA